MLGFFERQRLVKKGLATSKQRRRRTESELLETLDCGLAAKVSIFVGFMIGLALLIYSDTRQEPMRNVFIALLIFITAVAQLWINHPKTFERNSRLLLIFGVSLLHLGLVKMVLVTADNQISTAGVLTPLDRQQLWALAVPLAFAPLTLSVLLGRYHGLFAAVFVSLWSAIIYRWTDPVILVMSLICGFVAVFVTLRVRRWTQLLRAGVFVGLATWVLAGMFGLIGPIEWSSLGSTHWRLIGWQSAVAIGSGVLTALLAMLTLPIFQALFRITTDISWLELSDLNHPLLKRLTIEAPGTYHHSLVVANISEAAAEAIGANATMCRVCSYFHDIGKLVKPEYFTENMRRDRNPHDELAPTMSALIIIAHVKEGIDLALKHGLNQEVIDVIQQHHGTSLVFFFYKRALQQQEDARAGGKIMNMREEDLPEVREESFRYSGPRPQTREAAIISLADSIESASRSLEKVTPQKIDQLVGDIIQQRLIDGQLKECDLTMRELEEVAESFKHTLQSMLHSRVAYPSSRTERSERGDRTERAERRETPLPASRPSVPPRLGGVIIHVENRQRSVPVDLAWLRRFAVVALEKCAPLSADRCFALMQLAEIEVAIVSDRVIARVHRDFMGIPGATDVITFAHGEIVMSAQTAQAYAHEYGHSVDRELALYTVHGLLHLNGYEDAEPRARARMHAAQERVLRACLKTLPLP